MDTIIKQDIDRFLATSQNKDVILEELENYTLEQMSTAGCAVDEIVRKLNKLNNNSMKSFFFWRDLKRTIEDNKRIIENDKKVVDDDNKNNETDYNGNYIVGINHFLRKL